MKRLLKQVTVEEPELSVGVKIVVVLVSQIVQTLYQKPVDHHLVMDAEGHVLEAIVPMGELVHMMVAIIVMAMDL